MEGFGRSELSFVNQLKNFEKGYLAIQKEKQRVLASIDNLQEGFLILDANNTIEYANSQFGKILGLVCKKVMNKNISELKDSPNLSPIISLLAQDVKYSFKKEIQINENLILEVFINRLVISKKCVGTSVVVHDITKEKIMGSTKRDFVSLTAHQLNVPLSTTKLSLEMLLDGSLGKITDEQRDIIEKTQKRNNMLIHLVNDLLDIAKIEDKGNSYHCEEVDFEALVKEVVDSDKIEMKNKKIVFEFAKPENKLPKIILDRNKMFLALKNMFDNAIKYTPEKGTISVAFEIRNKELEFKIQDSGIGVPNNEKEKIFDKFFRSSNAIKTNPSGSGLGLFIAKNIIEAHNGEMGFESVENKGSTFFFTIPIKEIKS